MPSIRQDEIELVKLTHERATDIMEVDDADGHAVVFLVVETQTFRQQLFPAVRILGLRWVGVLFFEWCHRFSVCRNSG